MVYDDQRVVFHLLYAQVVTNEYHSVILTSRGRVLVCGFGRNGRLGLQQESALMLQEIPSLQGIEFHGVCLGKYVPAIPAVLGLVYAALLQAPHHSTHSKWYVVWLWQERTCSARTSFDWGDCRPLSTACFHGLVCSARCDQRSAHVRSA